MRAAPVLAYGAVRLSSFPASYASIVYEHTAQKARVVAYVCVAFIFFFLLSEGIKHLISQSPCWCGVQVWCGVLVWCAGVVWCGGRPALHGASRAPTPNCAHYQPYPCCLSFARCTPHPPPLLLLLLLLFPLLPPQPGRGVKMFL